MCTVFDQRKNLSLFADANKYRNIYSIVRHVNKKNKNSVVTLEKSPAEEYIEYEYLDPEAQGPSCLAGHVGKIDDDCKNDLLNNL